MKKRVVQRFLSLALSAAMVFVGLPSAVYAAEESSTGNSVFFIRGIYENSITYMDLF